MSGNIPVTKPPFSQTPMGELVSDFTANPFAVLGFFGLLAVIICAIFAPYIAPQNPYDLMTLDFMDGNLPPGSTGGMGQVFMLGTDDQGRDVWSSILYGLRTSLAVGAASAFIAFGIGCIVGLIAAYAGGLTDTLIMRLVELQLSFPAILIAMILVAVLGQGTDKIILALVAVQWAYYARTIRGLALVEKGREYIEATHVLGFSHFRIVLRHLLPNCIPPLIVIVTMQVASAIALEATLSFLGIGLPLTEPSLGQQIANGYGYMQAGRYWLSIFPGVALLFTIVSLNLVGDHLRDILNPKTRRQ
ncbi:ABC transporter permease [Xinfangfangia sp. CPCC 101601]|uniref:ABC transporter permease n=1 Tax=Pseudogemmobacter lacusdianii TaxID=3069608 RepID=A0ABU0W222_9RHOB|nr:ABC transporter permease [Xinfangfangia sp. CPCC 101601]MDQ2067943.1 ABC transporter permease [Xinfangfangia sp. CPCC 101601]